jgi:hypothetical protein
LPDLLAPPPRDNVCFDLFALFGAVQTPLAGLTARLLLNLSRSVEQRDTERSGDLWFVKVPREQIARCISRPERRDPAKQSFRLFALREDPAE